MRGTAGADSFSKRGCAADSRSVGRESKRVLGGSRQKRQRLTPRPLHEPGAVIRRQRMPALSTRQLQVTLLLVAGGDGKALGGAEDRAILHPRHVVVAGQFQGRSEERRVGKEC